MSHFRVFAFVALWVAFPAVARGSDYCEQECVKDSYREHCGQAICVHGASNEEEFASLCAPSCVEGVTRELRVCLEAVESPSRISQIVNILESTINKFCDSDPFDITAAVPAPERSPEPDDIPAPPPVEDSTPLAVVDTQTAVVPGPMEGPAIVPAPGPAGPVRPVSQSVEVPVPDFSGEVGVAPTVDAVFVDVVPSG